MSGGVRNVVIGGGTGKIGRYLISNLIKGGHNVSVISRHAWALNKGKSLPDDSSKAKFQMPQSFISWDDIEKNGLPLDTDVVVNLSGTSIGNPGPWVNSLKKSIYNSRIDTTKKLAKAIQKSETPPDLFIAASAVGVYGLDSSKVYSESDPPVPSGKESFFTDLCLKWEESSQLPVDSQTRVVNPRFGVVLAHDTHPMQLLLQQTAATGGSIVGSGEQPFPWIHMEDAVRALNFVMENKDASGPVNFVAPQIVDNTQFTHALGAACSNTSYTTLPAFLVRLMYGTERADKILLDSPKCVPQKLLDMGFEFQHKDIDSAMNAMVNEALEEPPAKGINGALSKWFKLVITKNRAAKSKK